MAFLDPKERIMDVVLTEYGRQLLAENSLDFVYYAFSDEGIDYSGSIATKNFTGSIDDVVFRNFSFEEQQRAKITNSDLKYFLYTIPAKSSKIPEFIATPTTGSTITLDRNYYTQNFSLINSKVTFTSKPLDIVFRVETIQDTRASAFVKLQNYNKMLLDTKLVPAKTPLPVPPPIRKPTK
jgi:hypothetical protein